MSDELDPWLYGNPESDAVDPGLLGDPYTTFDPLNEQKGVGSGQSYSSVGVDPSTLNDPTKFNWQNLLSRLSGAGSSALNFATSNQGIAALIAALMAAQGRQQAGGGGYGKRYTGPAQQLTRTMTQGKYGPIARYAASGGVMQAYANGGAVRPFPMQDGGFVMTADAVRNAGGHQGMQRMVPNARPIQGPGNGTSDSIPAYIQGPNGRTPAKVSNGEAYIPPGYDTQDLYALMRSLERKA